MVAINRHAKNPWAEDRREPTTHCWATQQVRHIPNVDNTASAYLIGFATAVTLFACVGGLIWALNQ